MAVGKGVVGWVAEVMPPEGAVREGVGWAEAGTPRAEEEMGVVGWVEEARGSAAVGCRRTKKYG